jgi:hypothetical protein
MLIDRNWRTTRSIDFSIWRTINGGEETKENPPQVVCKRQAVRHAVQLQATMQCAASCMRAEEQEGTQQLT